MGVVEIERSGPVAHVWLDRPRQHNALSPELGGELAAAFAALADEPAVRVIVLGGRGPSFCAGADLEAMRAAASAGLDENLAEAAQLARVFAAVAGCPKPVVGRIHGHALGGGVGLVCACDIAVAARDTRFGFAEVRLGILPALISPYVLRRLADGDARELMLTGERFDAEAAKRVGLVQHVAAPDDLDGMVTERVGLLLAGGPQAQARIKALLERWEGAARAEYRAALPRILAEARTSDEAQEGLAAALENRTPGWARDV